MTDEGGYRPPIRIFNRLLVGTSPSSVSLRSTPSPQRGMKVAVCEDADWLLPEEAFSIYASCMYHPTYNDYVGLMEDYLSDTSKKVFVYEDRGKKTGLMVLKISEDAAEIIGIAVSDNARRKGIGTQLIQRVMESEDLKSVKAQTDDD